MEVGRNLYRELKRLRCNSCNGSSSFIIRGSYNVIVTLANDSSWFHLWAQVLSEQRCQLFAEMSTQGDIFILWGCTGSRRLISQTHLMIWLRAPGYHLQRPRWVHNDVSKTGSTWDPCFDSSALSALYIGRQMKVGRPY